MFDAYGTNVLYSQLRGRATAMYEPGLHIPEYTFLKLTTQVWPPSSTPTSSSAESSRSAGSGSSFSPANRGATLAMIRGTSSLTLSAGRHSWPFAFVLPISFALSSNAGKERLYELPPSYAEKAYLAYTIHTILRRDIVHSDIT